MTENFYWEDFFSELMAELLYGLDVEEVAKVIDKAANTVACFTYKSKPANMPNVKQLGQMLDYVQQEKPQAVRRVLTKLCGRYGLVAGRPAEVLRKVAAELEAGGQ